MVICPTFSRTVREATSGASGELTQWANQSSSCVVHSVVPTLRFIPAAIVWVALERQACVVAT
jgi:hypothetical protein